MKEKSSLAKRLSGLIALALVLAMTMGITASAAGKTYYTNHEKDSLYTNYEYATVASRYLHGGDEIYFTGTSESGYMLIRVDESSKCILTNDAAKPGLVNNYSVQDGDYTWSIEGTQSYAVYELPSGEKQYYTKVINLTTYTPEEIPDDSATTQSTTKRSCNHRAVELRTVRETTATQDGIRAWFCVDCDEKLSEEMLSSYAFFLQSIIYQIEHAESGSTVEISSEIWNSLSQDVMLALAARRDINIVFTLRYNHEDYRIEIPAGTTIDTKDAYYGPLYLGQLYGMTKIKK